MHRLQQCELFQEWSGAHKKDFDGLLYGLIGPLNPTAEPAPEICLPVQVRPHLVCYLICEIITPQSQTTEVESKQTTNYHRP